ncbi:TPA: hypothetical protein RPW02_001733 [Campylobacter fetus subsp. venerealis]|jgi:hypothetical protein|uniref:hypothetical protein n=1 Tax=Campylobacter fetus TaxID=196 RepID=UPI00203A6C07|nr:hypothetical protein [Campylobacter fetus]WKW23948.1 hypothetical protein IXZ22_11180 [Campylobacter fetus subsp. venerealis]HDX6244575.1 hypothetical protein [Campylobacter fetus subsp. venerealis]HDX6281796.1 hypothetical protein [Campylobacter fetus subsp. venerealis]HDX6283973.1 hypothetical protein [Campylobacter fetus subsp. venerealis]HDX6286078.1 hypothetical protein [Campylobacter fetus subsp. venerealis]
MSDLEIFKISITLMEALNGDREAIADLSGFVKNHPEMFKNNEEVAKTISEVLLEHNLVSKNHRTKAENDLFVAKRNLSFEDKMGDVGIRNEEGTNRIYHVLKRNPNEFNRLLRRAERLQLLVETSKTHTSRPAEQDADINISGDKTHSATVTKSKIAAGGRDAHTPYTQAQSLDGRLVQKNISPATDTNIIPQSLLNNLKECENINQFARDLTLIIKQNPNQDVKFYDDLVKDAKLKVDLTKINEEKFTNAINSLKENKTALMEALIKTNLKSISSNLKLDNGKGLNNV